MSRVRRYPSDTTDAQWALIDPLLPDPAWLTGQGGRREVHCRRAVVDAIFYLVDNGIKWRALPADFPPWSTVYNYFAAWEKAGLTQNLLDSLRDRVRLREGRTAEPTAAIADSQSIKAAETVGRTSRGFDAGKKINGRKRHIVVDTLGLLLCVLITTASTQDRDGARPLLDQLAAACRRVRLVWADGGYAGKLLGWAKVTHKIVVQIVKRTDDVVGFQVLPRRWVVERTLAWITRHRRCVRDYERLPEHHAATVPLTMIRITSRRLTK
ncbi:IS5 family transposase [Actinophytocola glycyrrhizae]|uniref:IS5 family transposase n=1 Tax=Actinophytocola glycyrrhizae TaxID=2044873 RepID=A0ABV9RVP0_9PSEU